MKQYLELCRKALDGTMKPNRTGIPTVGYFGDMVKYNLRDGFPAVTTKKLAFRSAVAEMLGFLRGYSNARDFERLGCNVWTANANENEQWLNNLYRRGDGDLGRIYGVQARNWASPSHRRGFTVRVDQLRSVYDDLCAGIDNRREIVTHWNPGELHEMALPPCHMFYQFNLDGDVLNMSMYQRSCDLPLGVPFNIAGYAWLLQVMARITGHKAGTFTHMMGDIHVYENQIELLKGQLMRDPYKLPHMDINPKIKTIEDLETWVTPQDFILRYYQHHPAIKYPFAL